MLLPNCMNVWKDRFTYTKFVKPSSLKATEVSALGPSFCYFEIISFYCCRIVHRKLSNIAVDAVNRVCFHSKLFQH